MQLAVEHHQAGRMGESEALCREVLRRDPRDFDALHLLGIIRLKAGAHAEAVDHLRSAYGQRPSDAAVRNHLGDAYSSVGDLENAREHYLAATRLDPSSSEAFNNLGVTYARAQHPSQAEPCFTRAIANEPNWAVPHFNLGLSLKEQGAIEPAMKEFHQAWKLDRKMLEAMRECAWAAAQWARANPAPQNPPIANASAAPTSVSIVFCSIDDAKCAATVALYERVFAGLPYELIPIRDARSLAEAYNRGIAASKGDVVLLSHDDVDILASDFAQRLLGHLSSFDVVGVIGATDLSGPTWRWSGHPYLRGWITHRAPREDNWYAAVVDPNPVSGEVVVLDGVFFAARRAVCEAIPFDEQTFDGFHLYDVDWSYRAAQAGYRLAAAGDLLVVHASRGRFDGVWTSYADKFCAKHSLNNVLPPSPSDWAEAVFRTRAEVRAFFGLLASSK
jgi:Flp pilus assembly protein TadD